MSSGGYTLNSMDELNELRAKLAWYENRTKELEGEAANVKDFVENTAMPLHWVDAEGIIIWANQAELRLLGYAKEEYIGFHIRNFHEDEHTINDILTKLTNDQVLQNYPARLRCKDGSIKHVLITSNVLRENGKFVHTRCSTVDITDIIYATNLAEIKKAEEQSARLSAIIESTDDAIISKTLNGIITSWNHSAERTFGYKAEEMIGQSILKLIPEDRLEEEPKILSRLRNGERVEHFETRRMRKDGTQLDVSLTISPVRDIRGNIIGLSKIARDITEKKQEENRKNDFVAMVSHELKTPLTSITAYLQMVLRKLNKENNAFEIGALIRAELQARKMASMIHDFLSLAKIEDGKIQMNKEDFELHPLIEEIAGDAQFLSALHTVKLVDCEDIVLHADRNKIGQVLTNLLSNAIKYSPDGGTIVVGCQKENGSVKIYVSDQGVGISAVHQKRLFERFYRVNNEQIKAISGFGIGLYLITEILRYHQTEMHVESEEGKGSTFYFSMPIKSK